MDLTAEDLENALDFPLAGWASCETLYGCDPPNPILSKDSAVALLINLAPTTMFYRGEDQDPLSIALRDAHAKKVPNNAWAKMEVNGKMAPTIPGVRKASVREPLQVLGNPHQKRVSRNGELRCDSQIWGIHKSIRRSIIWTGWHA